MTPWHLQELSKSTAMTPWIDNSMTVPVSSRLVIRWVRNRRLQQIDLTKSCDWLAVPVSSGRILWVFCVHERSLKSYLRCCCEFQRESKLYSITSCLYCANDNSGFLGSHPASIDWVLQLRLFDPWVWRLFLSSNPTLIRYTGKIDVSSSQTFQNVNNSHSDNN